MQLQSDFLVIEEVEWPAKSRGNETSWYSDLKANYFPATLIIKCKKL